MRVARRAGRYDAASAAIGTAAETANVTGSSSDALN
jgi:hypothetical protein